MKIDKKLKKAIYADLEARKAKAHFHGVEHDKDVAEIEKEIEFYECGLKGEVPQTWIERYCEEVDE
ncbi:hypothetical protein [Listeria booriae]|uniref:hypothetical protein n=1 Tax=Listeria booriae TaxID=1552123 RepID=UPI001628CEDD|nr:hypothetical protein [Listeria booriae]MBC2188696.1 hypothetical protein [Listeria booriae]